MAAGSERLEELRRDILRHDPSRFDARGAEVARSVAPLPEADRERAVAPLFAAGQAFGALHEIVAAAPGDLSVAFGFALDFAGICARMRPRGGLVLIVEDFGAWETGLPYGPGFVAAGLDPARTLLVRTHAPKETLLAMETALRSPAVAGVLAESAISPKLYDLATSRRLLLAARTGGSAALFLPTAFSGQAAKLSSAATARFEIARARSRSVPFGRSHLPIPGRPAFSFRLLKAPGGLTDAAARTREQWRASTFGIPLDEAAFHAFSFDPPALPADRPCASPREDDAEIRRIA